MKGVRAAKCASEDASWRGEQISLHSAGYRIGAVEGKINIEAGERHAAGGVGPVGAATAKGRINYRTGKKTESETEQFTYTLETVEMV